MSLAFIQHLSVPLYLFRYAREEDFILESVSEGARNLNPGLSELVGRSLTGLYRDQPYVLEDALRCVQQQQCVVRETRVRRYDRTEATQHLRLRFIPVDPGRIVICLEDIGGPDVAQAALAESEARYRSLVTSLPDAVLLRGAEGRVLTCNQAAVNLFGAASQADLLGRQVVLANGYRLCDERSRPLADDAFPGLGVLATGQAQSGSIYALERPSSETRWLRVAAEPVVSASGSVTGSVCTFTDITEQVEAQRALRASAERLDLALSAVRMGVWEYDPQTDAGWWSSNMDEIFRLEPREPGMASFAAHVHPEDRGAVLAANAKLMMRSHGDTFEQDLRMLGSDQEIRWARVRGRLSRDQGGRTYLAGTVMDITEQRQLEDALRRAHRLESIGRLAGGVAHDFNNLLSAMMGAVELLEDLVPEAACADLAIVRHAAMRGRDLTQQLLAFARKQPLEYKRVDLANLVGTVERLLQRLVGPSIQLVIRKEESPIVRADPSLLEQVLVNLVVNARDAMPNGGKLVVRVGSASVVAGSAELTGELALLEVIDSGEGMDARVQGRIFEPFFTTKSHGTGLGLASSYGIVKQHGGDIVVESEPFRGTCFQVRLPRLSAQESRSESPEAPVEAAAFASKGRVLVVDDEPLVLSTTVRLLESLGYEALAAKSASEANAQAASAPGPIDILLCDVAMPECDGPSVASRLLAQRPELKVVFVSGYAPDGALKLLPGALYLPKPYRRADLAAKLEQALQGAKIR